MAQWEIKTQQKIDSNTLKNQKTAFDNQHQKFLDMRRQKLSNLLQGEEAKYHSEIIANQDTPEVVRRRMEEELKRLKAEKMAETDDHIQKLQEKRFYDSADELRKNDSEAFAVECYLEQENQMIDKLRRRQKEKREEEVYVKLNEFDNMKKLEKEKQDEEAKKAKLQTIYNYQQWQRDQNQEALKRAQDLQNLENERMREQWKRDAENEEAHKRERQLQNINVYKEIEEFNNKEEAARQKKIAFEKAADKELVDSIVAKEKALDEIDKAEKLKRMKEFEQNKKYLQYVMNQ